MKCSAKSSWDSCSCCVRLVRGRSLLPTWLLKLQQLIVCDRFLAPMLPCKVSLEPKTSRLTCRWPGHRGVLLVNLSFKPEGADVDLDE